MISDGKVSMATMQGIENPEEITISDGMSFVAASQNSRASMRVKPHEMVMEKVVQFKPGLH